MVIFNFTLVFSPHCLGVYRLSHILKCSTIGTTWLDFCVRDGNRYTSRVLNTKTVNRKIVIKETVNEPKGSCVRLRILHLTIKNSKKPV